MITGMSSPLALQANNGSSGVTQVAGDVTPSRVAAADAAPAHAYFNVIREILHKIGYHTEGELLSALNAVHAYERKQVSAGDLRQVSSENDRAAIEDVSKRVAPGGALPNPVRTPEPIDYNQLAAALAPYLVQQQAVAQAPVPSITTPAGSAAPVQAQVEPS